MTAFANALGVLFSDPNLSLAATWKTGGIGAGLSVRVVRRQPDQIVNFGTSRAIVATTFIDVRKADVSAPDGGDIVTADGTEYEILGSPKIDTLGLVWTCEAAAR